MLLHVPRDFINLHASEGQEANEHSPRSGPGRKLHNSILQGKGIYCRGKALWGLQLRMATVCHMARVREPSVPFRNHCIRIVCLPTIGKFLFLLFSFWNQ